MGEGGGVALDVGEDGAAFVVALLFTAVGAGVFTVWALYFNLVRLVLFFWRKNMVTGQVVEVFHCRDSTSLQPWKELLVVYTPVGSTTSLQCKLRVEEGQALHVHDQVNLAYNRVGPLYYSTRHPFDQPAGNRRAISVALWFLWSCCFVIAALVFAISGQYRYSYCIPLVACLSAAAVLLAFILMMADKRVPSQAGFRGQEVEQEELESVEQPSAAQREISEAIELSDDPLADAGAGAELAGAEWEGTEAEEFAVRFSKAETDMESLEEEEGHGEEPSMELGLHEPGLGGGLLEGEEGEEMEGTQSIERDGMYVMELDAPSGEDDVSMLED